MASQVVKILHTRKFWFGDHLSLEPEHDDETVKIQDFSKQYSELDSGQDKRNHLPDVVHMAHFRRQVLVLRKSTVTRVLLLTVDEYLDKLIDSVSWLTLLKASMEVFHGEMRGFANLSD